MPISYEDTKRDFEAYHFKVLYPRLRFITIYPPGLRSYEKYYTHTLNKFQDCYENVKTIKDGKTVPFLPIWLKDPYARSYYYKDFKPPPLVCHRTDYNAFTGFKLSGEEQSPTQEEDHRNHFEEFCTFALNLLGSKEVMDVVLKRYACRLKAPGVRTNICLVLYGKGGTGKNVFFEIFDKIFEGYYTSTGDINQLKWDIFEKERLFILINTFDNKKNIANWKKKILNRMNSDTILIRQKYEEKEIITNLCDYDMTANIKCFDDNTPGILQVQVSNYYIDKSAFFQDFCSNIIRNPIALRQIQEGLMDMY